VFELIAWNPMSFMAADYFHDLLNDCTHPCFLDLLISRQHGFLFHAEVSLSEGVEEAHSPMNVIVPIAMCMCACLKILGLE
jgi:hypothetical protein